MIISEETKSSFIELSNNDLIKLSKRTYKLIHESTKSLKITEGYVRLEFLYDTVNNTIIDDKSKKFNFIDLVSIEFLIHSAKSNNKIKNNIKTKIDLINADMLFIVMNESHNTSNCILMSYVNQDSKTKIEFIMNNMYKLNSDLVLDELMKINIDRNMECFNYISCILKSFSNRFKTNNAAEINTLKKKSSIYS